MTTEAASVDQESGPIPLHDVEHELVRRLNAMQHPGEGPVLRACLSNLVVYCHRSEQAEKVAAEIPGIIALHPARVLLLVGQTGNEEGDLTASVWVRRHQVSSGRPVYSEQVTLRAQGQAVSRLPFVVRTLLISELPINLWWAVPEPPPLGGPLLDDLAEYAQQILYDSIGWLDPARGVVAAASWLAKLALGSRPGRWTVAADLNWRRLRFWRRLLGQALDPASAPGALESISEVLIEHGPHAVIQAWELAGWLGSCLGWRVERGRVQPGVEMSWKFRAPKGSPAVRFRRLSEGPSEIRRVRIACTLNGKPGALNLAFESEHRLSVMPEGIEGAVPRTMTVQTHRQAELVGQQLSDRGQDPAFMESMGLGRGLARCLLGDDREELLSNRGR
ncbi:MAG: glucose-6-phosphate dehydrogenase assembly protein OpcA [Planctomycetes bacterium]|nr:glucose-6-phosphate dehydrogenase assembly protein OpcA [Planctomycetota bacterium]